ncbi:hypothetical protein MFMK1_002995 [Metallumcola ferriviriculae]|uniref:Rhodanese domain-containing protein n=1 Tax=Metallumcola ferriviriculae TaxID=3039180 RepID=A0AAU0US98_9FIRM|nr:hypothetical protein MFMK1_002995 [Desulfitibacteraceae bacterium MK1]
MFFKGQKLKFFGLLLVLIFSISLVVGCGGQGQLAETPEKPQVEQAAPKEDTGSKVDAQQVILDAATKYYEKMPSHIYKITSDEVKDLLDSGTLEDYLVLDITGHDHYAEGHIQGAIDIPFAELGQNLDLIATNAKGKKAVLVVCWTGQTAGQTVAVLNMLGINARSINLGMELGWKAKNYPMVQDAVELKAAEAYDWGDKLPVKEAVEKYFDKMPSNGMFKSYKISEPDLKDQLEKNPEKFVMIDIRGHEEYAKGTVTGAIDIPFKEVSKHFAEITEMAKGKTAVVACYTGQTAGQTDAVLNLIGIKTVSLNRGINAGWVEGNGFELVKQ